MCGIFGLVTIKPMGLYQEEENFLRNMLVVNAVRGDDGAGMFWVGKQDPKKCHSIRKSGNPYWLMLTHKSFPNFWKQMGNQAKIVVGHNRYGTKGDNKDENTHPFREGPITMVHNGTITYGLKFPKGVEVDSHALTIALAEEGTEIFANIFGAFACVWHDARDGTLNIAKNDQRPLTMVRNKGTMYFASELGMLDFVLGRNVQRYWEEGHREVIHVKNNVHYRYHIDSGEWSEEKLPEKKYSRTTLTPISTSGSSGKGSSAHGTDGDNEERIGAFDVSFSIVSYTKQHLGATPIYTYQGVTSENEACFFKSNKLFDFNPGTIFHGRCVDVEVGKFPGLGADVPWYRIKPNSVARIADGYRVGQNILDTNELDKALKFGCLCCKAPIEIVDPDEVKTCDSIQVSNQNYRLICPKCKEAKAFDKLSIGLNDASVMQ